MKKYNFFNKIFWSIYSKDFYLDIIKEPFYKSFIYLILLSLILSFPSAIISANSFNNNLSINNIPSFIIKDGKFDLLEDEPYIYSDENTKIIIDENSIYNINDIAGYNLGILINPERIIISRSGIDPYSIPFNTLNYYTFSNENLIKFINDFKPIIFIVIFVLIILNLIFSNILFTLLISFIGAITKNFLNIKITYEQVYKISIYSCTLSIILKHILIYVPSNFPYFLQLFFYFLISYLYLTGALKKLKNENSKI